MSEGNKSEKVGEKENESTSRVHRRDVLASLFVTGGLLSTQNAKAKSPVRPWQQDVNAHGYNLQNLGSLSTIKNKKDIADFSGKNLFIKDGVLHAEGSGINVQKGESTVQDVKRVILGDNISITDKGEESITIESSSESAWTGSNNNLLELDDYQGIDVESTKVNQVNFSNRHGEEATKAFLDSYIDDDRGSVFDFDSGSFSTTYDIYTIKYVIWNTSGVNTVALRVQDDNDGDYGQLCRDGTTQYGRNRWKIGEVGSDFTVHGEVTVRGGNPPIDDTSTRVSMSNEGGGLDGGVAETGRYLKHVEAVDKINLFTTSKATGKLAIWGENLS